MSESVNLPALGESVTEGTVTRWLKNVGDRVEVDEPLLEVSTDKVDTEIPSPIAGVIEAILVQEDETVEVGTALVTIGDGSERRRAGQRPAPRPHLPRGACRRSARGTRSATTGLRLRLLRPPQRRSRRSCGAGARSTRACARPGSADRRAGSRQPPHRRSPPPSSAAAAPCRPLRSARPPHPPARRTGSAAPAAPTAAELAATAAERRLRHPDRPQARERGGCRPVHRRRHRCRRSHPQAGRARRGRGARRRLLPPAAAPPRSRPRRCAAPTVPMSRLRKVIAERAVVSMQTLGPAHDRRRGRCHEWRPTATRSRPTSRPRPASS